MNEETAWEPYTNQSATFSTPNGLPGMPVSSDGNYTDENGQQWVCDEIGCENKKYMQRIGKYTTTGNESIKYGAFDESNEYQSFSINDALSTAVYRYGLCNKLLHIIGIYQKSSEGFQLGRTGTDGIINDITVSVKLSRLTDYGYDISDTATYLTSFKAWLTDNPLKMIQTHTGSHIKLQI